VANASPGAASAVYPAPKGTAGPAPATPSLPLLPPTGPAAVPAHHAPLLHHAPLAPKTSPFTLDPGPLATTCNVVLNAPAFIPVNADDDNGSQVTNGIPAQRDFNVWPIPGGDPELQSASVTVNCNVPGELAWSAYQIGTGRIALWTDNTKSAPVASAWQVPPGQHTYTFSIEGAHESSFLNDVTLDFGFTFNITGTPQVVPASQDMTVTPLINSFAVTPAGGTTGQNIFFTSGNNGNMGLAAGQVDAAGTPTVFTKFTASVNDTNLPGALTFVQNIENVQNGVNGPGGGTTYKNQPVGWLYDATGPAGAANLVVKNGSPFPLLDIPSNATDPDYPFYFQIIQNDGTTYSIQDLDSPTTGNPDGSEHGTAVDVKMSFTLWLLWRYDKDVNGVPRKVYYPIAKYNWTTAFLGTAQGGTAPINTIQILHGVTADPNYTPPNLPPDTMSSSNSRGSNRWNGNNDWVSIN
jgi:hypothetical protein